MLGSLAVFAPESTFVGFVDYEPLDLSAEEPNLDDRWMA
jgi:hypothetical protein